MKSKIRLSDMLIAFLLLMCSMLCLVPILNTLAISFSDKTSAALGQVKFLPVNFNLASYQAMMEEKQFWISFMVSIYRVILGTGINMFLTILMAYPLSKSTTDFRHKKIYMWVVVFTMMFSGGLIPTLW